jgi:hypothetical protein
MVLSFFIIFKRHYYNSIRKEANTMALEELEPKIVDGEEVDDSIDETDLTSDDVDDEDWEKDASSDNDAPEGVVSDDELKAERASTGEVSD